MINVQYAIYNQLLRGSKQLYRMSFINYFLIIDSAIPRGVPAAQGTTVEGGPNLF